MSVRQQQSTTKLPISRTFALASGFTSASRVRTPFVQALRTRHCTKKSILSQSIVLLLMFLMASCGYNRVPDIKPEQPNMVSLNPQDWYIFYSAGVPQHPSADADGAWSFDFPSSDGGGHVNYVETPFNATIPLHSVTVVFEVESKNPQYVVVDPTDHLPATCRLMIEQQGDDLADPNGRWWANASIYNLGSQDNQIITFNIPFTPDIWSNVYGQKNAQAFANALSNIGWVGITFGGQYFAGHGVAISGGSAKFVLINYSIE
jgi:hypothetical protein